MADLCPPYLFGNDDEPLSLAEVESRAAHQLLPVGPQSTFVWVTRAPSVPVSEPADDWTPPHECNVHRFNGAIVNVAPMRVEF